MFCLLFKQKTAYELRISDWSSDVCASDLGLGRGGLLLFLVGCVLCERCACHWQRQRSKQRDAETVWLDSGRTCSHDFPQWFQGVTLKCFGISSPSTRH